MLQMCPLMQETRTNQTVQFCFIVLCVSTISNLHKEVKSLYLTSIVLSVTRLVSMEADGAPFTPLPPVSAPFLREFKAIATRIRRKSKQTQWFDATLVWNEYNLQNHDSRQDVSTVLPSAFFGGDLKLKLLQAVHSDCLPGSFELSAEIYFEPFEFGRMPK